MNPLFGSKKPVAITEKILPPRPEQVIKQQNWPATKAIGPMLHRDIRDYLLFWTVAVVGTGTSLALGSALKPLQSSAATVIIFTVIAAIGILILGLIVVSSKDALKDYKHSPARTFVLLVQTGLALVYMSSIENAVSRQIQASKPESKQALRQKLDKQYKQNLDVNAKLIAKVCGSGRANDFTNSWKSKTRKNQDGQDSLIFEMTETTNKEIRKCAE